MMMHRKRDGSVILKHAVDDTGLWFESPESARRWADGMGLKLVEAVDFVPTGERREWSWP